MVTLWDKKKPKLTKLKNLVLKKKAKGEEDSFDPPSNMVVKSTNLPLHGKTQLNIFDTHSRACTNSCLEPDSCALIDPNPT